MVAAALRIEGRRIQLEPARSNDPRIAPFEAAHPLQRWCLGAGSGETSPCSHCSRTWQTGPARIATLNLGQVVAVARIGACRNGELHGHLTITVAQRFERSGLGLRLLAEIRKDAQTAGFDRLYACLLYGRHDVVRDCREAGFAVESMLSGGSISELVLRVGGDVPGPARHDD